MMVETWVYCVSGTAAVIVGAVLIKRLTRSKAVAPKDTVVVYQFSRGPWAPSMGPFCLKLETFLRITKIPYVNDHKSRWSSKGKIPSISYNNEHVADSQFAMEYLKKKREVDLDAHLSPEQKAVSKAFQRLVEDNLYWILLLRRWVFRDGPIHQLMVNFIGSLGRPTFGGLLIRFIGTRLRKNTVSQGLGRHTKEELAQISEENLQALSNYLGNKKYLMGDVVSEIDCTTFGLLAQFLWQVPGSLEEKLIKDKYSNLYNYCNRMKDEFWPDWDECITHGFTRKAAI